MPQLRPCVSTSTCGYPIPPGLLASGQTETNLMIPPPRQGGQRALWGSEASDAAPMGSRRNSLWCKQPVEDSPLPHTSPHLKEQLFQSSEVGVARG